MAIAKVADRASVTSNTAATTVDLVLTGMTIDNYLIIRSAADNSGGGGAARTMTLTNQSGTPVDTATDVQYTQLQDPGAASAGTCLYVNICKITATSGTVRLTYSGSVVQATVAEEWSGIDLTTPVVGTPVGANGTASANYASVTDASIANGNVAYGAHAVEGPSGDTFTQDADTTNGTWVSLTKLGSTNTTDAAQTVTGGYKIVTAAGAQTYNPTGTARDSAGLIIELGAAPVIINKNATDTLSITAGSETSLLEKTLNKVTTDTISISVIESSSISVGVLQSLSPDAILTQMALTGAVAAVQDDPDASDGSRLTGTAAITVLRVSFPTPNGDLVTGFEQKFRIKVRPTP